MSLGVLNNIAAIYAQNNLTQTQASLQKTLQQLSSGSRINSGADDAAGLAVVSGLNGNVAALTQSTTNANEGVGLLQTADGALAQVTGLLNRATTLATEASNGTLNTAQLNAADAEFQKITTEIGNIGSTTTYNGKAIFSGTAVSIVTTDGTTTGHNSFSETVGVLTSASVGESVVGTSGGGATLGSDNLTSTANAATALTDVTTAIADIANQRAELGASINQLVSASNVAATQQVNLTSAANDLQATNYGQAASDLAKYQVLSQTGIAALAQSNTVQQEVLKLVQ